MNFNQNIDNSFVMIIDWMIKKKENINIFILYVNPNDLKKMTIHSIYLQNVHKRFFVMCISWTKNTL